MLDEVMTQDTNAADDGFEAGFLSGLGEEYAEDEAEQQDTNAAEPQEEETEESTAEQDTNATEESPKEETTNEQPEEAKPEEVFEVTFLGEKKQLTRDEAVMWTQKGMNAEHTIEQLNGQLEDSRANVAMLEAELAAPRAGETLMPLIKAYAKATGGSLQDLTNQMLEAVRVSGIQVEKPEQSNYMREKAVKDWQDFMKAYPEVRNPQHDLPKEVWDAISSGLTPRMAYIEHRQREFDGKIAEKDSAIAEKDQKIAALEQEIRTLKLNAENQKKAVGSLSSTAEKDDKTGFLGGLFM